MRQIVQDLKSGSVKLVEVPVPVPGDGMVLIRTRASLVSAGTERMLVDFGRANWFEKVRQQPDKVRQVLDKMGTDGVVATLEAVQRKLDQPLPMGYSNVGEVVAVGAGVREFRVGDRVASNGAHAGFVCVSQNLCASVPAGVSDDSASFAVVGAIALQGVRLAAPTLGEVFVVSGLGLVGLLAVQLLRANGCQVIGADYNADRLSLARAFGARTVDLAAGEDPVAVALEVTRGVGVDGVLVCVASDSNDPIHLAAHMCRKRGRIVLVGVTGLDLVRDDFYKKELTFQVSCSYGPGRYDRDYEEGGHDYPLPYVRWTEQRNFAAVLALLESGDLDVSSLITHRIEFSAAPDAYDLLADGQGLGLVFTYANEPGAVERVIQRHGAVQDPAKFNNQTAVFGVIGAGGYASAVLLPAFRRAGARFKTLISAGGLSASHNAERFDVEASGTDIRAVLDDAAITAVIVATRHDSHAGLVVQAIDAGKLVFVEKPLATSLEGVQAVEQALQRNNGARVMVGFNRRFAPLVGRMKALLDHRSGPKSYIYTVNAGSIPKEHWTQGLQGGGRIVGEVCHFIDLIRYLCGSPVRNASAVTARDVAGAPVEDIVAINLEFEDGSLASINYFANGSAKFPKERLEAFAGGGILVLDNFKALRCYGWKAAKNVRLWRQDKGQRACALKTVQALNGGGPAPIPFAEIAEVSRLCCRLAADARAGNAAGSG